jgi:uncharacterized protein (DUF4415 family)
MNKPDSELPDEDVPDLDDDFFAHAKPAHEVMPADFMNAVRNRGGRPKSRNPKVAVSIRLDQSIVEHFKAQGAGWQSRINAVLTDDIKSGRA